jgi:hypothetical protein
VVPGVWVNNAVGIQEIVGMGTMTMNMTTAEVVLNQGSQISPPLIDASVDVNGKVLAEQGAGTYLYINSTSIDFSPGEVLNLTINSPEGNASSTLTVPPAVSIIAPPATTTVSASAGFNISWSYTGGTPAGVTLEVADSAMTHVIMQYLPGTTTNFNISSGQALTGTTMVILMVETTAPFTGANAGSPDFIYYFDAMNYISVTP